MLHINFGARPDRRIVPDYLPYPQGSAPVQQVFQDNQVYCGGYTAQQVPSRGVQCCP